MFMVELPCELPWLVAFHDIAFLQFGSARWRLVIAIRNDVVDIAVIGLVLRLLRIRGRDRLMPKLFGLAGKRVRSLQDSDRD
jgi:hypothetical protein